MSFLSASGWCFGLINTGKIIPEGSFPEIQHEELIGPFKTAKEGLRAHKKILQPSTKIKKHSRS